MRLISIDDPNDPRIAAFRDIRERDLTGRQGLFVAEGTVVLRVLASPASLCGVEAVLMDRRRLDAHADIVADLAADTPVYAASQAVLDAIAGFPLHRGVLALGRKPTPRPLDALLRDAGPQTTLLAVAGVGNHDNMGGLFRNAAAFGAQAVVLDDRCCDPFYRKAIRVSAGAVLRTPVVEGGEAANMVRTMIGAGIDVLALTPTGGEPLHRADRRGATALLVGTEGTGLPREVIALCRPVSIPMSGGFDSLNVATAAALALHRFTTPA